MRQLSPIYFATVLAAPRRFAAMTPSAAFAQTTTSASAQSFIGDKVQKGLGILNDQSLSSVDHGAGISRRFCSPSPI